MAIRKQTINIGIFGLGTVGTGIVELLHSNRAQISQSAHTDFQLIQAVVHDLHKSRAPVARDVPISTNPADILENENIQVVIEAMGTIEPAKTYISAALNAGKHVITANKDLLATHGTELIALAQANHVDFFYEASVAGGIQILQTLTNSYASDNITQIVGILNGTANYILTQMSANHLSYANALQQAQELGFAESNPIQDINGLDSAYKLSILSRFAFGADVQVTAFPITGITAVTADDLHVAEKLGYSIKLLASGELIGTDLALSVAPTLVAHDTQLAAVRNENNGIALTSTSLDVSFFAGKGAGSLPTAQSIINDVIHVARNITHQATGEPFAKPATNVQLTNAQLPRRYFVRTVAPIETANGVQQLSADRRSAITTRLTATQLTELTKNSDVTAQYPIWD